MTTGIVVNGVDVSLAHGAIVAICLDPGTLEPLYDPAVYYFSTTKSSVLKPKVSPRVTARHLALPKNEDKMASSVLRLRRIREWAKLPLDPGMADNGMYTAIEGYAYGAKFQAHQLGEVGGIMRLLAFRPAIDDVEDNDECDIYDEPAFLRIHSPTSAKLFCAGTGAATKDEMIAASKALWSFPEAPVVEAFAQLPETAQKSLEDIVDAHALAQLLVTELRLRKGTVTLESLPEHMRQVFLTTGKDFPANVLARPFIGS